MELAAARGVLRARDLKDESLSPMTLSRLVHRGELLQISRGLYAHPGMLESPLVSLAIAARKIPRGVICLLSALRFHELTTQSPFEVWMALPPHARVPTLEYPVLRVVYFTGKAETLGVEIHPVGGVDLRVTSLARTVIDCFRYRHKIGIDVALEALRESLRERRVSLDELWVLAEAMRAARVMRPYLEGFAVADE